MKSILKSTAVLVNVSMMNPVWGFVAVYVYQSDVEGEGESDKD